MPNKRVWDISQAPADEVVERKTSGRIRNALASTAVKSIVAIGLAGATAAPALEAVSSATATYTVVKRSKRPITNQPRAVRRARSQFEADVQQGMSTAKLGRGVPVFFRQTTDDEIDDVDLPLL